MPAKVFVINLRGSTERRKFIVNQLLKLKLDFELIDAYGASDIDNDEFVYANSNSRYDKGINKEEIACAKSHIKALKAIVNDNTCTHGLIIEDDVYLSSKLPKVLAELTKKSNPEDVILLYSIILTQNNIRFEAELCSDYKLVKPEHCLHLVGAQAYFLSKDKAQDYLCNLSPVTARADDWNYFLAQKYFSNLYLVYPFPVLHAELLSDIRENKFTGFLGGIKKTIIKFKIFPLYQLYFARRRREAEARQKSYIHAPEFELRKTYKL